MPNTLMFYNPTFYAQESLMVLEKALGMTSRVYRGYEPSPQQKGNTINISKPGTFVVQDAPGSTPQDINPTGISIVLDQWKEVKFQLTDKELTFTKEKIISDHIGPAAYAIADHMDMSLAAMYKDIYAFGGVPGVVPGAGTGANAGLRAITGARKIMQDALIPDDGRRHWMIDSSAEEEFLNLSVFNSNPANTAMGTEVVQKGHLRNVMGLEIFASQNTPYHNKGTLAAAAAIVLQAGVAKGATITDLRFSGGVGQCILKDSGGGALTGTLLHGDIFTVAGDTQTYVVLDDTIAAGNQALVKFYPAPKTVWAPDAVVTVKASHNNHILFHQNAFALGCAPLSEIGTAIGAVKISSITRNNLSIRARLWYDADWSTVRVGLDILYGLKTLQPELAARYAG